MSGIKKSGMTRNLIASGIVLLIAVIGSSPILGSEMGNEVAIPALSPTSNNSHVKVDDQTGLLSLFNVTWGGDKEDKALDIDMVDGSLYIIGDTSSYGNGTPLEPNAFVAKFDISGNLAWSRIWGGAYWDSATAMTHCGSRIFFSGFTFSYGERVPDHANAFIAEYTTDGKELWNRTYSFGPGTNTIANSISTDCNALYVAGDIEGGFYSKAFLMKTSMNGSMQWFKLWGGPYDEVAYAVKAVSGRIYICGWTSSNGVGTPTEPNAFVVAYDTNGYEKWEQVWGDKHYDTAIGLDANDTTIMIVGMTKSYSPSPGNLSNIFVAQYRNDGTLVRQGIFGGHNDTFGTDIVMENDRILVTGSIRKDVTSKYDALLIQINALTMQQEGITTWGGPEDDFANALLCDNGNNYIAGETYSFGLKPPNAFIAMPESLLLPDLVVSITIKEVTALIASSRDYQVQIIVSNVGTDASNQGTHLILSIDNVSVWDTGVNPLGQNQSILARYAWNGPNVELHEISVVVDPDNLIPELNEINNIKTIGFEVTPKPIIDISNIQLDLLMLVLILVVLVLLVFIAIRRKRAKRTKEKGKEEVQEKA